MARLGVRGVLAAHAPDPGSSAGGGRGTRGERAGVVGVLALAVAGAACAGPAAVAPAEDARAVLGEAHPPTVALPAALARVLADYEAAWRAGDEDGLAALFAEDGWVLSGGRPPVRGRQAIRARYRNAGGPLALRAFDFALAGDVGYVIGGYARVADEPDRGKFTLTLRRGADGRWLIVSDMDNGNAP